MEIFRLPEHEDFYYGNVNIQRPDNTMLKFYDFFLLYCNKGSGSLMIDLKEYEVHERMLVVILPGSIVSGVNIGQELDLSLIICSQTLFQEASFRLDVSFFDYLKNNPVFMYDAYRKEIAQDFMVSIGLLYGNKAHKFRLPIFKNLLQCFLMDVCDKALSDADSAEQPKLTRQEMIFKRFIDLVHVNYIEQREVSFYADKLCITPRYLSSVVNKVSGHTPKEFIDRFVVLEIKALLESTDLSMQQIASQLHFPDQSFFGRFFKKHTGVMPSRYRSERR